MHLVHYDKALAPSIEFYKWIARITFLVKKERKARKPFAPSSYPRQEFFGRILNKNLSQNGHRILTKLNLLRGLSEISRGGGEVETEGGSQLFETQKREGS